MKVNVKVEYMLIGLNGWKEEKVLEFVLDAERGSLRYDMLLTWFISGRYKLALAEQCWAASKALLVRCENLIPKQIFIEGVELL
jgi:hypothetical protein